ncbi:MAG TPA: hypothetical protein VM658_10260 [bacterium]|nr:hypothetical protein [bacterium]
MKTRTFITMAILSALLTLIGAGCGESGFLPGSGQSVFTSVSGTLDLVTAQTSAVSMAAEGAGEQKIYVAAVDKDEVEIRAELNPDGSFVLTGLKKNQRYILYFYAEDGNGDREYLAVLAYKNKAGDKWERFVEVASDTCQLGIIQIQADEDGVVVGVPANPPATPDDPEGGSEIVEPPAVVEENRIILPAAGSLTFTLESAEAGLMSDLYLAAPFERLLINDRQPEEYTLYRMIAIDREVELAIEVDGSPRGLGAYRHSSLSGYARVTRLSDYQWRIEFEDLPFYLADWDYNDMVVIMTLEPVPIADISTGSNFVCAMLADGRTKCWGSNQYGELGDGRGGTGVSSDVPVSVYGVSDAVALCSGYRFSCVVDSGGWVHCWGKNDRGELGNGTLNDSLFPQPALWVENAVDVTCGYEHACALIADGSIECWGYNDFGQLGSWSGVNIKPNLINTTPTIVSYNAVTVPGITDAVAVTAGDNFTCAILAGGTLQCWGDNRQGQLGVEECGECTVPGDDLYAHGHCEVLPGGTPNCYPPHGWIYQLEFCTDQCTVPTSVSGLQNVVDAGLGVNHACAVLASGDVKCWGQNQISKYSDKGMLGDGTTIDSVFPVTVAGNPDGLSLNLMKRKSCLIESGGAVECWGGTQHSGEPSVLSPSPLTTIDGVITLGGGRNGTACALLRDGSAVCGITSTPYAIPLLDP